MARNGAGQRPGSKYGQHFLYDRRILARIADAAQLSAGSRVLEIGPGPGTLTQCLLDRGAHVVAVEIDHALYAQLSARLGEHPQLRVLHADFMQVDLPALWRDAMGGERFSVVSNLPYYITSDVLQRLLWCGLPIDSITLMLQREAVDRLLGREGRHTGALGVFIEYFGQARRVLDVPPGAFTPPPKVRSAVLHIRLGQPDIPRARQAAHFAALTQAAFAARRKTLRNNLTAFVQDEQALHRAMQRCAIAPKARAEELRTTQFVALSDLLCEYDEVYSEPNT